MGGVDGWEAGKATKSVALFIYYPSVQPKSQEIHFFFTLIAAVSIIYSL